MVIHRNRAQFTIRLVALAVVFAAPAAVAGGGEESFSGVVSVAPGAPRGVQPNPECPADSLFSQLPDPPKDFLAVTSEVNPGLARYEDFDGVAGPIEGLRWWGLDLDYLGGNNWAECAESNPVFDINFHEDAGGRPGALVCSYRLLATRTPLGLSYLGAELNEYNVTLPSPCVLVRGWVSIVGRGNSECWFLWMSAGPGFSWCDGCAFSEESWDLSVCLRGPVGGVFGACCDDATGGCTDNVEIDDCTGATQRFAAGAACAELDPPCGVVVGACCFEDATCAALTESDCAVAGGNWQGADTLCAHCPCAVPCPPGSVAEGEPVCGEGYMDTFNGGCQSGSSGFSPIGLDQTVCGQNGVFEASAGATPDFDWYALDLAAPRRVEWSIDGEFPFQTWMIDGTPGCGGYTILQTAQGGECNPVTFAATLPAGTYWFVVAASQFTDSAFCGATYTASLVAVPCPGDADDNGAVNITDLGIVLAQFGQTGGGLAGDVSGDGAVNITDVGIVLANFGAACW